MFFSLCSFLSIDKENHYHTIYLKFRFLCRNRTWLWLLITKRRYKIQYLLKKTNNKPKPTQILTFQFVFIMWKHFCFQYDFCNLGNLVLLSIKSFLSMCRHMASIAHMLFFWLTGNILSILLHFRQNVNKEAENRLLIHFLVCVLSQGPGSSEFVPLTHLFYQPF